MNTASNSSTNMSDTADAGIKKLLYVFEHGPYSTSSGSEALEAVLSGANFEQEMSLLFIFNGVYQLKKNQETKESLIKAYTKTFLALDDFGVNNVYVHDLSLLARGLEIRDLMIPAIVLSAEEITDLIAGQHRAFTF